MTAGNVLVETNGALVVACRCGGGLTVAADSSGRAWVAAWKTQHQTCATP